MYHKHIILYKYHIFWLQWKITMLFKSFGAVLIGVLSFFSVKLLFSKPSLTEKLDADYDYVIGKLATASNVLSVYHYAGDKITFYHVLPKGGQGIFSDVSPLSGISGLPV